MTAPRGHKKARTSRADRPLPVEVERSKKKSERDRAELPHNPRWDEVSAQILARQQRDAERRDTA